MPCASDPSKCVKGAKLPEFWCVSRSVPDLTAQVHVRRPDQPARRAEMRLGRRHSVQCDRQARVQHALRLRRRRSRRCATARSASLTLQTSSSRTALSCQWYRRQGRPTFPTRPGDRLRFRSPTRPRTRCCRRRARLRLGPSVGSRTSSELARRSHGHVALALDVVRTRAMSTRAVSTARDRGRTMRSC